MGIYPKAKVEKTIEKLDKGVVAAKCIERMELGESKAQAMGECLRTGEHSGSDDIDTFNEVWDAIIAESHTLRSTPVPDTATKYKAALSAASTYLDSDKWYSDVLLEKGVKTFTELKATLKGE